MPQGRGPPGRGPGRGHGEPPVPRAPPVPVPAEDFNFEEGIQKFNKEARFCLSSACARSAVYRMPGSVLARLAPRTSLKADFAMWICYRSRRSVSGSKDI